MSDNEEKFHDAEAVEKDEETAKVEDGESKDELHAQQELVETLRKQIDELNSQVSSLNQKLVSSYDRIGDLEDEFHVTKESEQRLKSKVNELELDKAKWDKEIEAGGWVEKNDVQVEMQRLMTQVMTESQNRDEAVKKHESLSAEIDNLTSSLFSEANKMVAVERMARARAEDKMRTLEDSSTTMGNLFEELQASLREKVRDLEDKEQENEELRRKIVSLAGNSTNSDEAQATEDGVVAVFSDGQHVTPSQTPGVTRPSTPKPTAVAPPHLLKVLPYQEFIAFVAYLRQLRSSVLSRPYDAPASPYSATGSSFAVTRSFGSPTPGSQSSTGVTTPSPAQLLSPHLPLSSHSSQPFIKRAVEEDSDPTLRLDVAPGLGLFSRRTVANAVLDGSLMIEPVALGSTLPSATCALCGVHLERWWSGPIADAQASQVNQTVRKVFSGSGWAFSSSSKKDGAPSSPLAPSRNSPGRSAGAETHSASASSSSFTFPASASGQSEDAVQLHTFRSADNASTRYPLCPNYCLPRLRAVCEFWNYVRVIERSLLLEDSFKIVKSRESIEYDQRKNASKASLASDRAMKSVDHLPAVESAPPAKNGDAVETEGASADAKVENSEANTEQEKKEGDEEAAKQATDEPTTGPDASESKQDDEAKDTLDAKSEPMARSPSGDKPPLPRRSSARAAGTNRAHADETGPAPKEQPQASYPLLPSPDLPPTVPTKPKGGSTSLQQIETIVGSATGWEDSCWAEVIKLKEAMFWRRIPATEADGSAVVSRGACIE